MLCTVTRCLGWLPSARQHAHFRLKRRNPLKTEARRHTDLGARSVVGPKEHARPLQRAGSPEAIASAVLWLVDAGQVTGQMIAVDGGQHLAWQTPDIVE